MADIGKLTYRLEIDDNGFDDQLDKSREKVKDLGKEAKKTERDTSNSLKRIVTGPLRDLRQEIGQAASATRSLQTAFSGFRGAALIGAATVGVGVLVELAGAAVAASGALLAVPAAVAVAGAAFGVAKLSAVGLGDALDAIADKDAEAFNEALLNLSPAARSFATALRDLRDQLKPLQQQIQERVFAGFGKRLREIAGGILPGLRRNLFGVADALNQVALKAADASEQPFFKSLLQRSLDGTSKAVRTLSGGISPLAAILDRVVAAGMPFIQQLAVMTVGALKSGAAFLQTESGFAALQNRITAGVAALGQILDLAGALGSALVNLFNASASSGQTLIQTLTDAVNQFNVFATSAEGKQTLQNFFVFTNRVLEATLKILASVAGVVLGVINAISGLPKPVQDFIAQAVALGIVLTPVILGLATFVNSVVALGPVLRFATSVFLGIGKAAFGMLVVIGRVALQSAAFLLRFAAQALVAGARVAASFLIATGPIGLIVAAIAGLVALVILNFNAIKDVVQRVWPPIATTITTAIGHAGRFFVSVWNTLFKPTFDVMAGILTTSYRIWAAIWGGIGNVVVTVVSTIAQIIFVTLAGIAKFIYEQWLAPLGRAIGAKWREISGVIGNWLAIIGGLVAVAFIAVRSYISARLNDVSRFMSDFIQGFQQLTSGWVSLVLGVVRAGFQLFTRYVVGPIKAALDEGRKQFDGFVNAGRDLIEGLVRGIEGASGAVVKTIQDICAGALDAVKNFFGIQSPSKVMAQMGRFITQGMINGIKGNKAEVARQARDLANSAINAAREKLNDIKRLKSDFQKGVAQGIISNITSVAVGETTTLESIRTGLKEDLKKAQDFNKNLAKLIKLGLSDTAIRQIAEAGLEAGGTTAAALAAGTKAQIAEVNKIQSSINSTANAIASRAGTELYGVGVQTAAGLVKGLISQKNKIINAIVSLAKDMKSSLRKQLGIKSPSRVMAEIGEYMMLGLAQGISKSARLAVNAATNASGAAVSAFSSQSASNSSLSASPATALRAPSSAVASSDGTSRAGAGVTVNQTNNINTEVDMKVVNRGLAFDLGRLL